jgi:8-oxo-dGTP diphosphatase
MQGYTLGFIFDTELKNVLLIRKERPDWQKGRRNGIGGHIEPNEQSKSCIVREVKEECDLETTEDVWIPIGSMKGASWIVDVYTCVYEGDPSDAKTAGDEEVSWHSVSDLPMDALSNVSWLVQLALDKIKNNRFETCVVSYVE